MNKLTEKELQKVQSVIRGRIYKAAMETMTDSTIKTQDDMVKKIAETTPYSKKAILKAINPG